MKRILPPLLAAAAILLFTGGNLKLAGVLLGLLLVVWVIAQAVKQTDKAVVVADEGDDPTPTL